MSDLSPSSPDMAATASLADVAIVMGSRSDWPTMKKAAGLLRDLGVNYEAQVVSAHRTPERLVEFAKTARDRGIKVIIAGAGGAAHLPGMIASMTTLPVLGVPVKSKALNGQDSLLSGATNAGLLAASILSLSDDGVAGRLAHWRQAQTDSVPVTVED